MKKIKLNKIPLVYLFLVIYLFLNGCNYQNESRVSQNNSIFIPKEGDLIFLQGKKNKFTRAVQVVTYGYHGAKLSHVGIVFYKEGKPYILEAKEKVKVVPLRVFLARNLDKNGHPKAMAGRLIKKYRHLIPTSIKIGKSLVGLPYNNTFNIKNTKAFYCSQLIYYCFKIANNGKSIFNLYPMTFKSPGTNKTFNIWVNYFKKIHAKIPEGKPGLNPGGMSRSPAIKIVHIYGNIDGMENND